MGLDAWLYGEVSHQKNEKTTIITRTELGYWRKHRHLHGWMQEHSDLSPEDFNGQRLYLDKELLNQLLEDVVFERLPETQGFFFGNGSQEDYKEHTIAVIKNAINFLNDNEDADVYYDSWW